MDQIGKLKYVGDMHVFLFAIFVLQFLSEHWTVLCEFLETNIKVRLEH
jgi:hypothetical protein